jgi:transcriptional regulator with XRE-family HTH domain
MLRHNLEGMLMREVGTELRALRLRRGLTLQDVARLSGGDVTVQGLSRIERNERQPSSQSLVELARTYEIEICATADGLRVDELA